MAMRFLVESGTYQIDNVGDIAMLQRTVRRLLREFPDTSIGVVTEQPERLKVVLPEVEPIVAGPWFRLRVLPVPRFMEWSTPVRKIRWREMLLAGRLPRVARLGKRLDRWATRDERRIADAFFDEVARADAVVAAGGGYVNDNFHEHAWKVFATLNLAQGLGKPTAMFGLGLGPISRHDLIWHGGAVARRLKLMTVREPADAPRHAATLGMSADHVVVAGDDAIALASAFSADRPPAANRRGIGVNLRMSVDADVPADALPRVSAAVRDARDTLDAEIIPLIIRTALSPANDVDSLASLFDATPGPAVDLTMARALRTPQEALAQIARCRVIVTGAYHNAIFAASMGIPVVGLSRSAYYASKLGGAARQFGDGVTVLSLDSPTLRADLEQQINHYWHAAPSLEAPLRLAAAAQEAVSEAAYAKFLTPLREKAR